MMKSLSLEKAYHFLWKELPKPSDLQAGEALLRIHKIGVCGTDYHAFRGNQPFFSYPRILGHELGAEVIELNIDDDSHNINAIKIGDKVSVEPYLNCGKCQSCINNKPNCCENLQVMGVHVDGGMSEFLKVPIQKIHASQTLNYEQLALVETLGIGLHAVNRAEISSNDLVLVIGAGPIGLSVIQFAKIKGAKVAVLDINQTRLDFAKDQMKADFLIENTEDFSFQQLKEALNGNLPTAVFDATGNSISMHKSFEFVCAGGKLVFVGLFVGNVSFHDPLFHRKEISLLASRNSLPKDFKHIIELMETGKIDTSMWITHKAHLEDLPEMFEDWLKPQSGVIKAIVSMS
jgi:2-desacetyl-2-hydroxyethyl bacteriochlorophyllide A dehydrogenase